MAARSELVIGDHIGWLFAKILSLEVFSTLEKYDIKLNNNDFWCEIELEQVICSFSCNIICLNLCYIIVQCDLEVFRERKVF